MIMTPGQLTKHEKLVLFALAASSKRFKFFVCHAGLEAVNTVPVMPRYFVRTSSGTENQVVLLYSMR